MRDREGVSRRFRRWARELKQKLRALYLASRHPRTPWYAKALAMLVVGYAFSPIDLIPDPIPVLGYLDDVVLLPAGIWLTLRLIPGDVWAECQAEASRSASGKRPVSWTAAVIIVVLWIGAAYLAGRAVWPWLSVP